MTLAELVVQIGADVSGFEGKIDGVNKKTRQLGQDLTAIGTGLTAGVTVPLVGIAAAALKVAGEFEQTNIAFTTMLGSAEKATSFLKELETFAKNTPFEFTGLTDAAKRLLAMGFEAEELIPTMTAVGNAVAGIGGGQQGIDRVTTALGQMQAKGKVSAEEMKQLTEAGIPAWQFLAKTLNTDVAGAMELVRKRAVDSGPAIAGLIDGMNEKFGGLMEDQSKTILGQFSNLKDELGFILRDFGEGMAPAAQDAMDAIKSVTAEVGLMAEAFKDADPATQKWIVTIGGAAAAVGPILLALGQIVNLSASSWKGLQALGAGIGTLATGPMAAWIAAGYLMIEQLAAISKGSQALVKWLAELVGIDFDAAMKRNADELEGFFRWLGFVSDEAGNVTSDYSALTKGSDEYLASLVAANRGMGSHSASLEDIEKAAKKAAQDQRELTDYVFDFIDALDQQAKKAQEAAQSLSDWLKVVNDNAISEVPDELLHGMESAKEALDDMGGSLADIGPVASQVGDELKDIFSEELPKGVKDFGKEVERTMKQVSTIVTDLGKNVAEGFIGLFTGDRGDFNAALDEQADDLRAALQESADDLEDSLGDRADAYRDFVDDVAESASEITSDHAEKLADQLSDLKDNLADRQQAYDRFVADASKSLQRLTEDYADSLADQNRDQAESFAKRKLDYDRDVEDANKAHRRKVADLEQSLAEELAKGAKANQSRIADLRQSLREENEDYRTEMERRAADFRAFQDQQKADQAEFEEEMRIRHERETADMQTEFDRRTADHQAHIDELNQQMADAVEASKKSEAEKLAALQESLDKQTSAYEEFKASALAEYEALKAETNAKLDEMGEKHRTILGDIGALFGTVFKEAGIAVTRFVVEELVGKLFKELGVLDTMLTGIGRAFGLIVGSGGGSNIPGTSIPDIFSGNTPSVPNPGSGAGSAAGSAAAGGALGWATLGVEIGSAIVHGLQFMAMNKSLDIIVNHTLRMFNVLHGGSEGGIGILGVLWKINEEIAFGTSNKAILRMSDEIVAGGLQYINPSLDTMKQTLWDILGVLGGSFTATGDIARPTVQHSGIADDVSWPDQQLPGRGRMSERAAALNVNRSNDGGSTVADDGSVIPFLNAFSTTGRPRTAGPAMEERPLSELEQRWADLKAFAVENAQGAIGGGGVTGEDFSELIGISAEIRETLFQWQPHLGVHTEVLDFINQKLDPTAAILSELQNLNRSISALKLKATVNMAELTAIVTAHQAQQAALA